MDEHERAREAQDRRDLFVEFGAPAETPYRMMEVWSPAPGDVRARYCTIAVSGAATVDDERPVFENPGESWARPYRVAVYGVDEAVYLPALATRIALTGEPRPAPLEVLEIHPRGEGLLLVVLRATVRHGDAPVYLDAHRHRDGAWTEVLAGLQHPHTQRDIEQAWRGLRQLREVARGKVAGAGRPSVEEFLARCAEVADAMWREPSGAIPVDDLEVFLGYLGTPSSRTTLYAWLEDYRKLPGYDWLTWPNLRVRLQRSVLDDDGRTKRDSRSRLKE